MCGRYTLKNPGQLTLRFDVDNTADDAPLDASYNVAPSQRIPVIVEREDGRLLRGMQWGFRPVWADAKRPAPINARAETLAERPLFRGALAHERCLIPADGFYEWQATPGQRTRRPIYIHRTDDALFAFAGIYAERQDGEASCAIITTGPNGLMAPIHDRMPAILDPSVEALWLDPEVADTDALLSVLRPYPDDRLVAYPVAGLVSSPRNNGPALIEPISV